MLAICACALYNGRVCIHRMISAYEGTLASALMRIRLVKSLRYRLAYGPMEPVKKIGALGTNVNVRQ